MARFSHQDRHLARNLRHPAARHYGMVLVPVRVGGTSAHVSQPPKP